MLNQQVGGHGFRWKKEAGAMAVGRQRGWRGWRGRPRTRLGSRGGANGVGPAGGAGAGGTRLLSGRAVAVAGPVASWARWRGAGPSETPWLQPPRSDGPAWSRVDPNRGGHAGVVKRRPTVEGQALGKGRERPLLVGWPRRPRAVGVAVGRFRGERENPPGPDGTDRDCWLPRMAVAFQPNGWW